VTVVPAYVYDSDNNSVENTGKTATYSGGYTYDGTTLTLEEVVAGNKSRKITVKDKDTLSDGLETYKRQ
jgi:hypothetical protein